MRRLDDLAETGGPGPMRWRAIMEVMAALCGFVLLGLAVGLGFQCSSP